MKNLKSGDALCEGNHELAYGCGTGRTLKQVCLRLKVKVKAGIKE